jgi:uncharacterized membrane protein YjgN (DUF898 family)
MRRFAYSLSGGKLFPLFIGFYIPYLICYAAALGGARLAQDGPNPRGAALAAAGYLGLPLLYILFTIPFLRRLLPALSLEGQALEFRGSIGRFLGLNLLGILLSVVTLGIYGPWYAARVTRYLAGETSYRGTSWEFAGKGGRLFVILLLSLVLPVAAITAVFTLLFLGRGGGFSEAEGFSLGFAVTAVVLLLVVPPYLYLVYRWFFNNLRLGQQAVRWQTRFWPAVGFIFLQLILTLLSALVYWPGAYIRLYAYFARRTVLGEGEVLRQVVGFDGPAGHGFLLLWGQTLLILVTLGIYAPWAMARVGRWFAEHTTLALPSEVGEDTDST